MNGNGTPSNQPAEVQLDQRPVEATPASASNLPGGAYSQGDPWPHSGATLEANGSNLGCHLPLGEDERLASAVEILAALKGALVAGKVVKNKTVSKGPGRTRGL